MYEDSLLIKQANSTTSNSDKFVSLGELYIADKPTYMWTILGSCVSVILHNPRKRVSALCHAQLSEKEMSGYNKIKSQESGKEDFRFVACSVNYMLEQLLMMGIQKHEIYASVYGGSSMIAKFSHRVGEENVNAALEVLKSHGLKVIEKNVGGGKSRRIRHFSGSGQTQVRIL